MPQPKQLFEEIIELQDQFLRKIERTQSVDQQMYQLLRDECRKLAATDVARADSIRAFVASVAGNREDFDCALRNLRLNNHHDRALVEEFKDHVNFGRSALAFGLFEKLKSISPKLINKMDLARGMFAVGALQSAHSVIVESEEHVAVTQEFGAITKAAKICSEIGVTDQQLTSMQDVASDLLRGHDLFWIGDNTQVTTLKREEGGPALLIEYKIVSTPDVAAEMSWELTSRLIDQELDFSGVSVNFVGTIY